MTSFGRHIAAARKDRGLSQKDLAASIHKEDGTPISPQYLNDIERDRRNPPSEHFLIQFASQLDIDADYLFYLADRWPEDVHDRTVSPEQFEAAFRAFRRTLGEDDRALDS